MKNQEDPILALCKKDPKGYMFFALLQEFEAEIDRHQERTGIKAIYQTHLKEIARNYIDGLRKNRTDLDAATEQFRTKWGLMIVYRAITINRRPVDAAWMAKDFFVTTPLRLEERAGERYEAMFRAKRDEHDSFISHMKNECGVNGPDFWRNPAVIRKYHNTIERHKKKLEKHHICDFSDYPSTIITAAFESFVLKYTQFDRQEHLETYSYLDSVVSQEEDKYFRRRMESFVKAIKKHAGDLTGMARVITKYIDYNPDCAGGSRGMYIDPFYPRDFTAIKFPSAQADFVAARMIGTQAHEDIRTSEGASR